MNIAVYRHCSVIFKAVAWLNYLVYIIVKLQTYCIFSCYVLSYAHFFIINCLEYASVTAPALVMGRSISSGPNVLLVLWQKQLNTNDWV